MAQITHYETGIKQVNGKPLYLVACGKELWGHAGVRANIAKVTCQKCINVVLNAGTPKPMNPVAKVELKGEYNQFHDFDAKMMHNYAHAHGWKKLGEGASRKCYDMGNGKVVKLNHNTIRFGDQCAKEVRRWNNADANKRQYLAPILAHGNGWVIMEKAQGTAYELLRGDFAYQIGRELSQATGFNDLHPANLGYFGCGVFKILDYAL